VLPLQPGVVLVSFVNNDLSDLGWFPHLSRAELEQFVKSCEAQAMRVMLFCVPAYLARSAGHSRLFPM
jgi:hypothetical protein